MEALYISHPYYFSYRKKIHLAPEHKNIFEYYYLQPLIRNHEMFTAKKTFTLGFFIDTDDLWHSFSIIIHKTSKGIESFIIESLK